MDRGEAVPMGLLVLAVLLSAVLAYEAAVGAIARRRATERALQDHARFAAWELASRIDEALEALSDLVAAPPTSVDARVSAHTLLQRAASGCRGCVPILTAFDLGADGTGAIRLVTAGAALPGALAESLEAELFGAGPRIEDADSTHRRNAAITRLTAGPPHGIAIHVVAHDSANRPHTIGLAAPEHALAAALLDATLRGAPLFPASLAGGLPNSEMLFVTLVGNARDTLFRSEPRRLQRNATIEAKVPVDLARTAPVAEPLGDAFRDLRVVVALDPDAAPWIDANTLPGRGLRYVAGVLVFTVALIGVAIHQLRRQQELVRLRAGFVSGVSHELRTPLAQIRLFADLLESGQLSDEQRRRASQIINSESQRLGYLVENVLRFSRSERAVERINLVPVDLSVLADDIALTLAPLVAARGATIERIGAAGIEALADPDALRQVIINLLDNAAKYGPPGQRIRIGVEGDGVHARVWVDDEGPGIPSGAREIVWAPFRRLERDVEAASGGSGIGLSVVREIVRLHGGDARITDAPGGGARVVITLAALASNGAEVSA